MLTFQKIILYSYGYYPKYLNYVGTDDSEEYENKITVLSSERESLFMVPELNTQHVYNFFRENTDFNPIVIQTLFFYYFMHKNTNHLKYKFAHLRNFLSNTFVVQSDKEIFLQIFQKIQRAYHALARFAFRFRVRHATTKVETDVFLAPIDETQQNAIAIYHMGAKYLYTIPDLMNIANTALGNTFFMYPEPNPIKNPYNNIPFSKSNLYHIYFFMKDRHFIIPKMFRMFFQANFNLIRFRLDNECVLKDRCISIHLNSMSKQTLCREIRNMLKRHRYGKKMRIHMAFPEDVMAKHMKPWLHLYYYSIYSLYQTNRQIARMKLDCHIKTLYSRNPNYGKRCRVENIFAQVQPASDTRFAFLPDQTCRSAPSFRYNTSFEKTYIGLNDDFMNDHKNTNSEILEMGLTDYFSDDEFNEDDFDRYR
jgi:hypothetical protein